MRFRINDLVILNKKKYKIVSIQDHYSREAIVNLVNLEDGKIATDRIKRLKPLILNKKFIKTEIERKRIALEAICNDLSIMDKYNLEEATTQELSIFKSIDAMSEDMNDSERMDLLRDGVRFCSSQY